MFALKLAAALCKYLAYLCTATLVPTTMIGIWPAVLLTMPDADIIERAIVTDIALFAAFVGQWLVWNTLRTIYLSIETIIEEIA